MARANRSRMLPHLVLCILVGALCMSGSLSVLLNQIADLTFRMVPLSASGDIVVVGIDRRSLDRLGPWPWPRRRHAQLLDRLASAGVRRVALDIDVSGRTNAADDQALADAVGRLAGDVILPVFRPVEPVREQVEERALKVPYAPFSLDARLATVNLPLAADGTARRYRAGETWNGAPLPGLADLLTGRGGAAAEMHFIDFGIRPSSIPVFSYIDILTGKIGRAALAGKTAIVGATAASLNDQVPVPVHGLIAGTLVHAVAAESLLQGRNIYGRAALIIILTIFLAAYFGGAFWNYLNRAAGCRVGGRVTS